MGTAIDLLIKSQSDFTSSESLGLSEAINYFHKKTLVSEDVRAFVCDDIFNDPKKNTRVSEGLFSSVQLGNSPEENDEITYKGRIYRVKIWVLSQGRYIITAEHKRHHVAKRVTV